VLRQSEQRSKEEWDQYEGGQDSGQEHSDAV
jgi:hypothetical protein